MNDIVVARPPSEAQSYISVIAQMANNPSFNLEAFQALVALKDKSQGDEWERAFNRAMVEVQRELPQVVRDAENTQTKSLYATLEAIGDAIDPVITKHGFSQSFGSGDAPAGFYRVVCTTAHIDGHKRVDTLDVPIDGAGIAGTKNKTATHAMASTLTYGRRILTQMVFNVKSRKSTPDDDGNAAGGRVAITDEEVAKLDALIKEAKANKVQFLKFLKVDDLASLPSEHLAKAIGALNAKITQATEKATAK